MSFVTPVDGTPAVAEHVAQLTETLSGTRAIPVTLLENLTVYGAVSTNGVTSNGTVDITSGRLTSGAVNATTDLRFQTGTTDRWVLKSDGHIWADTDNVYDIGASGANRPRSLYVGTSAVIAGKTVGVSATGGNTLTWNADGYYVPTPAAGLTLPLSQHLTFGTHNTYDIGVPATRPRTVYAGTSVVTPTLSASWITADVNNDALGSLSFTATTANGRIEFSTNGGMKWVFLPSGHFVSSGDNFYDIGEAAANRPRSIYAGTSFIGPGSVPTGGTTNQVLQKTSATNYAVGWVTPSTGVTLPLGQHLFFGTDNTYDIGSSNGASGGRPRTVYAGTSVVTQFIDTGAATSLTFRINGSSKWNISVIDFGLRAGTDNAYDIGTTGASRPRNLFLAGNADIAGDLTLSGSNKKIYGDFTSPNQIRFVTNQANSSTSFQVQPSGTGTLSSFYCWDKSDTANAAFGGFTADNGTIRFSFGKLGTASNPNMWVTSQAQGAIMYWWDSGKVQILKDVLQADVGLTVTGNVILNSYWMYGTGMDLGNAGNTPNKVYGYKAWGGAASLSCTGSSGFVIGGGIVASPMAMANGEAYLFIARDGYWWAIASQGVI